MASSRKMQFAHPTGTLTAELLRKDNGNITAIISTTIGDSTSTATLFIARDHAVSLNQRVKEGQERFPALMLKAMLPEEAHEGVDAAVEIFDTLDELLNESPDH